VAHVDFPTTSRPPRPTPNQVEMALLNLAVNARDAMPDGGLLTISAARASVGGEELHLPAPRAIMCACRSATPASAWTRRRSARAIEPFFSTKGIGKGTGLGLSMVHG
jgi:signal transduction histidine kinase